jgi:hypothetical protein
MSMQEVSASARRKPGRNGKSSGFRFNTGMLPMIRKAVNQRISDAVIAKMLGCRRETVQRIRKSKGISLPPKLQPIRLKITPRALNRLEDEAFLRGLTAEVLAGRMIEKIVDGNLFDALLED